VPSARCAPRAGLVLAQVPVPAVPVPVAVRVRVPVAVRVRVSVAVRIGRAGRPGYQIRKFRI
jgi:hypothetical protein